MHEDDIAREIVDSCICVHKELGPGLLESIYVAALAMELASRGLPVVTQQEIPVSFRGKDLGLGFRADLIVGNKVVIEIKSVEELASVHHKQLLTYLRVLNMKLGILVNFNSAVLTHNIKRIVNGL
jgi:GxxExxY protein